MNNWIAPNTTLRGETVELIPLEAKYTDELVALAKEKRIWEFYPFDCTNKERLVAALDEALTEQQVGNQFPFVIVHKQENKLIGSTRLLHLTPAHKKLEIGWTWLHPDYWATAINPECKLLLLTYCFEQLQTVRVQLKTDENNLRSRKAIEKIGGKFEGILRNDLIRDNGTRRHSAYYSIIEEEWAKCKLNLERLYREKKTLPVK